MSLLAELQRRKVFKVAAGYAVVGWIIVQVATSLLPLYNTPAWFLRAFVLIVMLGFPVALVLTWMLEVTPEGIQADVSRTGSKRVLAVALVLTALAIGWYWQGQHGAVVEGADAHSIAVLPFVNMSGDKENEYFSDGISEEILNSLAQMPELQVAARTSSFSFKGHQKEVPDIARELDVRMVLEGSVRKQGDRVRITAQLIDARKGFHLWSHTYDRDLKDIFAIQDEIAHAIADELKVKLGAAHADGAARPDTTDLKAYELYLKGMQLWQARGQDNMTEAERLFKQAVARDPKFAKAWAGIALSETLRPDWFGVPNAEALPLAQDAAERALALDPLLPEAYAALGNAASDDGRLDSAWAHFDRAVALAPSYATAWQWYGFHLAASGQPERGVKVGQRAIALDPKSPIVRQDHAGALWNAGHPEESMKICDALLAERPDWLNCEATRFDYGIWRKNYAMARTAMRRLTASRGAEAQRFAEQMMDAVEGKADPGPLADRLLPLPDGQADLKGLSPLADGDAMYWLVAVGRPADAVSRMARLAAIRPHIARFLVVDPAFDSIRCRGDFQAVVRQIRYADPRSARLCGKGAKP